MAISAKRQPQGLVRLNRTNPLTRRLTAAYVLNTSGQVFNAVTGKLVTPSSVSGVAFNVAGTAGVGIASTVVNGAVVFNDGQLLPTPGAGVESTIAFGGFLPVATGAFQYIARLNGQDLKIAASSQGAGQFGLAAAGIADLQSGIAHSSAGIWHVVYAMKIGGTLQTTTVNDGKAQFASVGMSSVNPYSGSSYFLSSNGESGPVGTSLYYLLVWDRQLTRNESASVANNPWQLFDAGSQTQFPMAAAAGGAGTNATFTGTFGAATTSGAGAVQVSAALAKALGGLSVSSAGALADAGALNQSLGGMTVSAAGTAAVAGINGALVATIGGATAAGAGTVAVAGALSAALGGATVSAAGTAANAGINAALNASLAGLSATGAGQASIAATMARTLSGMVATSTGAVGITGSLSASIGGLTITTAAGGSATATLAQQLGGMTAAGAGQVAIQAQAGATMGGMTLGAAAATQNTAALARALGGIATTAAGAIAVRGAASVTFGKIQPGIISTAQLSATLGGAGLAATGRVYYFSRSPLRTVRVMAQNRTARIAAQDRKTSGRI